MGLPPCTDLFDIGYLLPQTRCAASGLRSSIGGGGGGHGAVEAVRRCGACTNGSAWLGGRECAASCGELRDFQRAAGGPDERGRGRNLFFDLGSGTYSGRVSLETGVGKGPSIPLFYALYARGCILFDRIWAWEYAQHRPDAWWRDVPLEMREKLTFFNMGVRAEPPEAGAEQESVTGLLELSAKPEDFVVVKVDIDNTAIELSIVRAILASEALLARVDEIYFEYHFTFDNLDFGWGGARTTQGHGVDDALQLMHALRAKGVRAHFWI